MVGGGGRGGRGRERGKCSSTQVWAPAVEDLNVDDTAFLINALYMAINTRLTSPNKLCKLPSASHLSH